VKQFRGRKRQIGAWNPLGPPQAWNTDEVMAQGTQEPFPATGIEQAQGPSYPDDIAQALAVPQAFGLNLTGWINPYSFTLYTYPLLTTAPTRVIPANLKRAYLIMQNQGPGNAFVNFGQDVTVATATANSNGLQLIQTQFYEQIGGGGLDGTGFSRPVCFVSPDYVSIITDTAGTTMLIGEGVWRYVTAPGQST
jgi:hypothetical protein